jgi:ComF family protein
VASIAQQALDLIFPPRCVACRRAGGVLCASCLATFHAPEPPVCPICGHERVTSPERCPLCGQGRGPHALDGIRAAVVYEGAARQAVLALKFRGQRRIAEPLGKMLAEVCQREQVPVDMIVPVPLHPVRKRQRGYNQAALLAKHCAAHLGVPMRNDLLTRSRDTAPQASLPAAERHANVANAFALSPNAKSALAGKHIVLIDDVTTTGSTLDAAANALRAGTPASIWGIVLARPDERNA